MAAGRPWLLSLSAVLAVVAVLVLLSGAVLARSGTTLMPFRWIDVNGPFHRVSAEQIRAAVTPALARGFFLVNLETVRERALALPWVAEVEVRKHWPDALEVRIRERSVLGRVGDDQLVDVDGTVFAARGVGETRGLPLLEAEPAQMLLLTEHYQASQRSLEAQGRSIIAARLSPRGSLAFRLDNGLQVELGNRDQRQRWQRFLRAFQRVSEHDPRPISVVDLRYTHGFAVRYLDPAAAANDINELQP